MQDSLQKINLLDLNHQRLEALMVELKEPKFRAQQIIHWIHQKGIADLDLMTNLSKSLREKLREHTVIEFPEIAYESAASDGTYKWLLNLKDNNKIETVYIPQGDRATLCISSQVGCALNCSFCSTGKEGFNRNLTMGEIIGQLWLAARRFKITNVVMMGMGEPLLNYEPVLGAMDLMLQDLAYGLSKYKVTLSTSGVVPMLEKLKQDSPVALAVSLHAPNNELRNELVPLNKKYPLEVLIPACRNYYGKDSKRRVTFEYVMLEGINDQPQHAKQLMTLLNGMRCKINLIPFNPFPKSGYRTSAPEVVSDFQNRLMKAGFDTRVRRTRGEDIAAACGQLAGEIQDRTGRNERWQKTGRLIPIRVEENP